MAFKFNTLIVNEGDPKTATLVCINDKNGASVQLKIKLNEEESVQVESIRDRAVAESLS